MIYNPDKHHRRSIRLKGFDYSQPSAYFVTICVQDRGCSPREIFYRSTRKKINCPIISKGKFVEIINGEIQLNAAGKMIHNWWNRLPQKYTNVELDEYIVMPNHLHGIIIVGADPCVCPDNHNTINMNRKDNNRDSHANISGEHKDSFDNKKGEHAGSPLPKPVQLFIMIQWFKTMTTNNYIRNVKQNDWPPFNKRLWQRNYYERIVRDEIELNWIRKYITENPSKWDLDKENPNNMETN